MKLRTHLRAVAPLLVVIGLTWARAEACDCARSGPCLTHRQFGTDFIATVLNGRVVDTHQTLADGRAVAGGGHRVFTVRVEEDFSGLYDPGSTVEVTTGMGGGDCGYGFREGERYLIDANEHAGSLWTGLCSQTAPAAAAVLSIRELRAKAGTRTPDVRGDVLRYFTAHGVGGRMPEPLPNVAVTLTGLDGKEYRSSTDADGVFELSVVPAGAYTVTFKAPEGLSAWEGDASGMAVPFGTNGTGAGCQIDLRAVSSGWLSGRVVNALGQGVPGFLSVYNSAPKDQGAGSWAAAGFIEEDGSFSMESLDAGEYWLQFQPKTNPREPWYYPGSQVTSRAMPVRVEESRATDGLTFAVSP